MGGDVVVLGATGKPAGGSRVWFKETGLRGESSSGVVIPLAPRSRPQDTGATDGRLLSLQIEPRPMNTRPRSKPGPGDSGAISFPEEKSCGMLASS